jgi:hypothetical protein
MISRQHYLQLSIVWSDMADRAELIELLPTVLPTPTDKSSQLVW